MSENQLLISLIFIFYKRVKPEMNILQYVQFYKEEMLE